MDYIYLDHAAATPLWPEVKEQAHNLLQVFGNPGSKHRVGIEAKKIWTETLQNLARLLGCQLNQLIITSGATESINQAFFGSSLSAEDELIISSVEHSATHQAALAIAKQKNLKVIIAPVNSVGQINQDHFLKLLTPKTKLISLIAASNEYGTVLKLNKLIKYVREFEQKNQTEITIHADASQLLPWHKISLGSLDVDLMSFSGAKLGAGHQVGGLFVREPSNFNQLIYGGGQQNNLRSGTENVLGAVNLTTALKLAWENQADINQFRLLLEDQLLSSNLELTINGDPDRKLPNIISLTTPVDATRLIYALDNIGVGVSAGAACSASSQDTRVIEALGLSKKEAEQTIRISLGHNTTKDEIELAAPQIIKQINELLKTELELAKIKEIGKKLNQEYSKEDNGGN
ncbi:aminotransferase class V-fold PLP-dependent enzyme [Candidatus Berkelbacteria bacterium]|nr:aminotransferase class V-fold PLP-dependent enzyme [Candidatus Berkelbacteria bacterium]